MSGKGGPIIHGGIQFWKYGIVPAGKERILDVVDAVIQDYVADLGGEEEISSGQKILLHNLKKMLTFQLLVDEHLSKNGIIDKGGNVAPALSAFYLAAVNTANRITDKLGMKRVRGTESWSKYLAARERALVDEGKRSTRKAGAGEIVPQRGKI